MTVPGKKPGALDAYQALIFVLLKDHGGRVEINVADMANRRGTVDQHWEERDGRLFLVIEAKELP